MRTKNEPSEIQFHRRTQSIRWVEYIFTRHGEHRSHLWLEIEPDQSEINTLATLLTSWFSCRPDCQTLASWFYFTVCSRVRPLSCSSRSPIRLTPRRGASSLQQRDSKNRVKRKDEEIRLLKRDSETLQIRFARLSRLKGSKQNDDGRVSMEYDISTGSSTVHTPSHWSLRRDFFFSAIDHSETFSRDARSQVAKITKQQTSSINVPVGSYTWRCFAACHFERSSLRMRLGYV